MKMSMVTGPGKAEVLDAERPTVGPNDVLVRMRACGICGSDAFYITIGGLPPRQGHTPLGHEPAGEIAEVGAKVSGLAVGDHVVINPMAAPSGIIGNGGPSGALADYLLIENAVRGTSLEVIPDHVPWEVAALNEPMAVARHGANRCRPKPTDKVAVFGAGPIGLGATLAFKSLGVSHVVVVDLLPGRLDKALQIGADAVINSADEDVVARLIELHGAGDSMYPGKAGTNIYLDAAGVPAVVNTALAAAQKGATVGIVGVHKEPVPVDLINLMSNEITLLGSMGYPDEIFEVTKDLVANWEKYALIVSHTIPFGSVGDALELAQTPGAADKVVVTFG
ncbi:MULTISPECIES: zinc-dependent alcohol dehydrogenase [Mycobacterium]|jgi:threonine dehydrogenase-like Zn-dependent dehydrogenase|uniref:Zinc-binding dehydrogenase family protein n=3 Tax=Mycobacterium avium complex (MAC) TaxID=120793 RepID=X8CLU9_MYCIT|nr:MULTISPECIES: zinc-binding dehydrogenase [Mycobacterium]EUA56230.1 zinc-binding dehydrogenase family protein [Mycobacterium intracellulare 1956]AFC50399.1 oxidoreductase, zinc-binding dehydrogenase family protein [Mycobacterium intracellulare MOTT-02]AFC55657.1 oxidoreductase, zinc-binding dehydrogenase family protein [Mycobacterium paraintracellulare]AFS16092.1 Oxidoreductase, zinc-binding dehydrogenase family protein [Mycobacterium intracellulare subsp. intracellulare MTCC 9506]ASW86968.1